MTLFLILVFLFLIISIPFINKIYPNIYIAGVYAGDKNQQEAIDRLIEKKLLEKIMLSSGSTKYEISTSEIFYSVNYKKSVDRAYKYTNSGDLITDFIKKIRLITKPVNLSLYFDVDKNKLLESVLIISSKLGTKPEDPKIWIQNGQIKGSPGTNGVEVSVQDLIDKINFQLSTAKTNEIEIDLVEVETALTENEFESYKLRAEKLIGKGLSLLLEDKTIILNDSVLISFLDPKGDYLKETIITEIAKIAREVNRNPQNSVFIVENNKVTEFMPSKDGITLHQDKLAAEIQSGIDLLTQQSLKETAINIPIIKSPAAIRNEDVNNLGINTLLGKGVSNFKGSISNRVYNVNLAQSRFKGILIPPGEVASFNDILGDVSSFTGYKAAYVIKDGKTVLGDGGGVCQVSTTLFRALLAAGLPITERRAHAYRVGYYEQGFPPGLDATVYSPTTDLKFSNDTPAHILIQPSIDLNNLILTFEIYGTHDGRIATTTKPIISSQTAPPPDLYVDDPTLSAGIVKQIEHKAWGAKVSFDYKVIRGNETLTEKTFVSNYRSWGAVYLRGVGPLTF